MENFLQPLTNAIETRHSHRHYLPERIRPEEEGLLQEFIQKLQPPFTHNVTISLHQVPDGFKIVYFPGPKLFASFITDPSILDQAKLGFLGELFILYCESLGLKTCWMGHYWKKDTYKIVYNCEEKKAPRPIFCITPIGRTPEKTNFMDRLSVKKFSKKNKPMEKFLHPDSIKEIPKEILFALDLASKAPSAMNTQNWYYLIKDANSSYEIELSKPLGYQHLKWKHYDIDVGTAASHIWLGLMQKGINPEIQLENRSENAVWHIIIPKK